jgi:hypothetical protein
MTVRPPDSGNEFGECRNYSWRSCRVCGTTQFKAVVYFDGGSKEPAVGETATGGTSTHSGVIEKVYVRSGSWTGGDASGCLELTSPTGYERENYTIFQNNENLNGSVCGNDFAEVDTVGSVVINGVLYPDKDMVEYQGQWFCKAHFAWKFGHEWATEETFKSSGEKKRSYD